MGLSWIQYKGKDILYSDYTGIKNEQEIRKQLDLQWQACEQSPLPVLVLVNLQNSVMSPESTENSRESLKKLGSKVNKIALCGLTGFKPVIAEGVGRSVKDQYSDFKQEMFATADEAKEWLVS